MDDDELLDTLAFFGGGSPVEQVFLGHRQHAAGAVGRGINREMPVGDADFQMSPARLSSFALLSERATDTSCLLLGRLPPWNNFF